MLNATFEKTELRKAIKTVTSVVDHRSNLPALQCVRISSNTDGSVTLTGGDLENFIERTISGGGQPDGAGVTLLPARRLSAIIDHLPDEPVYLSEDQENGNIKITAGRASFDLVALDPEEYPRLADVENAVTVAHDVSFYNIADAIRRVRDAASTNENNQILGGIYLHFAGDDCRAVTTDGRRCAVKSFTSTVADSDHEADAILPAKTARDVMRAIPGDTQCTVRIDDSVIDIQAPDIRVCCKQIAGQYPNYKQTFPETTPNYIAAPRAQLLEAVERVALATGEDDTGVDLYVGYGEAKLEARSAETGYAVETIHDIADHNLEDPVRIVMNPDYFADGLKNMPGDYAYLRFVNNTTPIVFTDNENSGYTYLLMPMRS